MDFVRSKARPGRCCAIVMGLDVSGYGLVRALARARVPSVGLWRRSNECGRFSRYCTAVQVAPDDDAAWLDALVRLAARYDRPVLFPSNDRYAEILSRHRETLAPVTRFHWVDGATFGALIDKSQMVRVAERAGLPVPRTYRPTGPDVAAEAAQFVYPCVVKPTTAHRATLPGGQKALVCRNARELVAVHEQRPALLGHTLWQEIVEGEDDAIYQGTTLALRPGEVAAVACVRKIRQFAPGFGITSYGRTEWQEQVVEQSTRFVAALGWTGIASVEFKRSARDGRFYFIETNPRVPWYNVLFADAGVNLPVLSWLGLTRPDMPLPVMRQRDGVGWMSLVSDVASFWQRRADGRLTARAWAGSLEDVRSFAWYETADPMPAVAAAARLPVLAWRLAKT